MCSNVKQIKGTDKVEVKWTAMNGLGREFPLVYVSGKLDNAKTSDARWAMTKMGCTNFKKLAPEVLAELLSINDFKTLLDSKSSLAENGMSLFSILLTFVPEAKAVKLLKSMKAAKMLEAGGEIAVDLNKVGKAAGLTEKEIDAFKTVWKSEQESGKFASIIDKIDTNGIHHIMQTKHDWGKIVTPPTWENVKPLILEAMEKGIEEDYSKAGSIFKKVLNKNGKTIEVTYKKFEDGSVAVSDVWIKYN